MGALRPACSVRDSRDEGVLGGDGSPETSLFCQRQSWRGCAWGWWEPLDQLVLSETVVARVCLGMIGALRPACCVRDSRGEGVLGGDGSPETCLFCQSQSWWGCAWGWWEPLDQLVLSETVVTRVCLGVMGALRPACSVVELPPPNCADLLQRCLADINCRSVYFVLFRRYQCPTLFTRLLH